MIGGAALLVAALLAVLFWPEARWSPPPSTGARPFTWDRAGLFASLETDFVAAAAGPAELAVSSFARLEQEADMLLGFLDEIPAASAPDCLGSLEACQFRMGALAAARPELLPRFQALLVKVRLAAGRASRRWLPLGPGLRDALYRVIYGGRASLDEALAQHPGGEVAGLPAIERLEAEPSATPGVVIRGVEVHSGDVVLSRGNAAVSALIARGNPYPGSFSHAALVHIDEGGRAEVVESVIEAGLVVTPAETFLAEGRYRLLLLRPRSDLPQVAGDPMMPHRAASAMAALARRRRVPYDFPMSREDASALYCSEVVYRAYAAEGLDLWAFRADLGSPGLMRWLGGLGVRRFDIMEPSDLEYDPRLVPVAEWRNLKALNRERVDGAILDALLERAERGADLACPTRYLPVARLKMALSAVQEALGMKRSLPRGLGAAQAVRAYGLDHRIFPVLRADVESRAAVFEASKGHPPPLWDLVAMAREAVEAEGPSLRPFYVPPPGSGGGGP